MSLRIDLEVVELSSGVPLMLLEQHQIGIGISNFLDESTKDPGILEVHPVLALFEDMAVIGLELPILTVQTLHLYDILLSKEVAVIGTVLSSHLNSKGTIPKILELSVVRMPCHHGGRCEPIRQNGSHVIDPIPSG